MTRLDGFLAFVESHRVTVCAIAAFGVAGVSVADWQSHQQSFGVFYLLPVLLAAAALNGAQLLTLAVICAYLREAFDPMQGTPGTSGHLWVAVLNPVSWAPGSYGRFLVSLTAFAMTGFFVAQLNQRRRLLARHLEERELQMQRLREVEAQVRTLIETNPLAILTLDHAGRVLMANQSARHLLGFDSADLQGCDIASYLPILARMLHSQRSSENIRTNVECTGQRRDGEVFLASVWISTYPTSGGPGLAAVVWDTSENLRDREDAGLDSMMATSRVLIGAICHEVRNLASAAASAYSALDGVGLPASQRESFAALGTLISGLEKIASSGLREASDRDSVVTDLGTVLDQARVVMEPSLREAGVTVIWDLAEGLPLVHADHHSLLQVFLNLARNSRQALENCSVRELRVSASLEADLVVVRFQDTGPGVASPEALFRPFQPGAHSFGLGLYISRAILRSHGGGLRCEPVSEGSSFAVELWPVENAVKGDRTRAAQNPTAAGR